MGHPLHPRSDLDPARTGRIVALLMLAQGVLAPIVNFRLLGHGLGADFLVAAPAHAGAIRLGALLGMVNGALSLCVALAAWPVLRRHSERLALAFVAVGAAGLVVLIVEQVGVLTMLSLAVDGARRPGYPPEALLGPSFVARSARLYAHYAGLMLGGASALVFHMALWRHALVPRLIPAFGMIAALLEIIAVARPVLGYPVSFPLIAPLGIAQLALVVWLLAKGFARR